MTHDEAFLQAIIENPDDDTPRLVYADWLDEHDQHDRAEFIRVQCLQASLPWADDRQSELLAREAQLLARHYDEWAAVWDDGTDRDEDLGPDAGFRRGFIERVRCVEWFRFLERAPALFAACPVRRLTVDVPLGRGPALAGCSFLERVRFLRLLGPPADVLEVCRSPHLGRLEVLDLWGCSLGDAGVGELAALLGQGSQGPLRSVRCLDVGGNNLTDAALAALAASDLPRALTGLDLGWNSAFTVEGIRLLVSAPWWRRLEELNLSRCVPDSPAAGRLLAAGLGRARLRTLRADSRFTGEQGNTSLLEALAGVPTWGPLRALSLNHCRLDGGRLRLLLDCPQAAGLTMLSLFACGLENADLERLADCPRLCRLTSLVLGNNQFGDRGVVALAESPYLRRLRQLSLQCDGVTDTGIAALARSANVEHLRHLAVRGRTGDGSVQALARSPRLDHLYALHLEAGIADDDALLLAGSPFLCSLTHLRVGDSMLSKAGHRALQQATHGVWGAHGPEQRGEPFFSWEA